MNAIWSMDFVTDALFDGRRLRTLPIATSPYAEMRSLPQPTTILIP